MDRQQERNFTKYRLINGLGFIWLNLNLKLMAVMQKLTRYWDRVLKRVDGVASSLDHLDHSSHLLRRGGAFDIQDVGNLLACRRDIGQPQLASGIVAHTDVHLGIVNLNIQL